MWRGKNKGIIKIRGESEGIKWLKREALEEIDTDMSGILQFKEYEESLVRARDVVKKSAFGVEFVVFGLESQQRIHYAMPLRTLLYDGLGYLMEYQELAHFHKEAKDSMTKDEFLSGIRKEDRLHPIVSVTVYYGEQSWDGPLSLKEVRNMCTALEKLKNEGRQEGIQESVRKLLQKGISVREVADLLELTEAEVLKIQQKC